MKKYLVLRNTHGFQGRYFHQDDIVEFEDDVVPPHHFQPLSGQAEVLKAEDKIVDEKTALSQMQRKQVKPMPTAGTVLKNQKRMGVEPEIKKPGKPEDF